MFETMNVMRSNVVDLVKSIWNDDNITGKEGHIITAWNSAKEGFDKVSQKCIYAFPTTSAIILTTIVIISLASIIFSSGAILGYAGLSIAISGGFFYRNKDNIFPAINTFKTLAKSEWTTPHNKKPTPLEIAGTREGKSYIKITNDMVSDIVKDLYESIIDFFK